MPGDHHFAGVFAVSLPSQDARAQWRAAITGANEVIDRWREIHRAVIAAKLTSHRARHLVGVRREEPVGRLFGWRGFFDRLEAVDPREHAFRKPGGVGVGDGFLILEAEGGVRAFFVIGLLERGVGL